MNRNRIDKFEVKDWYYTRFMTWYRGTQLSIPFFNALLRLALRLHYSAGRLYVRLKSRGKDEAIDQWYRSTLIFFIFASNRSGTKFLADFLNSALADGIVQHEAKADDYWSHPKARQNEAEADRYIRTFRRPEIYLRVAKTGTMIYGEVNPFLRRHVKAIQAFMPEAKCIHMTRDGRDVVRSLMTRLYLGPKDPTNILIRPIDGDPYLEKWDDMDRFARICWIWSDDNRYLRKHCPHRIQFEKIRSDYAYFKKEVLDYLGISISEDVWKAFVAKPRNHTPEFTFPRWEQWSDDQKRIFSDICGEEMRLNGYLL
ncbi:MAG: sulfotransferase [Gammaproteobacteria bacterium]